MQTRILYLFTRTPLHVGAGSSVGAIDQPIVRERHTGFPIIPGSAIKGVLADAWNDGLEDGLVHHLSAADSRVLQHATTETLAYLAYLKRFAPRD